MGGLTYRERKALGRCPQCHRRRPPGAGVYCADCLAYRAAECRRRYLRRKRRRLCVMCGEKRLRGQALCGPCVVRVKKTRGRRRRERLATDEHR